MKFRFDANQEFQVQAIEAVADLFVGQACVAPELVPSGESAVPCVANRLDLDDDALLANLHAVQARNGLPSDERLELIEETISTAGGERTVAFPNFSVEMETGTGKTYVYLRTALELNQRYGMRKFVIVVPSVAVREGVLKTLQVTQAHLREQYGNVAYTYAVYDSANLTQVRSFALSDQVELLIMTIDAFNKATNVINQSTDRLQGETPIHLVQAARPVLVLDEPQNMESELRVRALAALNPLLALRYSATHRNVYNLVYRLTPFDAYRQGLVKKIEVASVVEEGEAGEVFLRLDGVETAKKTVTARLGVHKLMANGTVREQVVTVRGGDSLVDKTGRSEYAGYEIDEISVAEAFVRFANDVELTVGEARGVDREAIFREQIRETVETHLRRQRRLRDKSWAVKVLSLFFIDRVANYVGDDALIRRLFDEAFDEMKAAEWAGPEWAGLSAAEVQAGYFAEKRHKGGATELVDSVGGASRADEDAYELIMRKKERLLSFDEPVSFIFSHSALKEGWDNPNIFQICTLKQTGSEMRKRQEIGRGVRLAVDQQGERVRGEQVNVLTVVANESYEG